mgnify:CR=1 FL=1
MSRKIYAAILGAGTVGTGVYKLCQSMKDDVISKTGAELVVKKVLVRNLDKDRDPIDRELLTDNWKDIIEDKDIEIVIELMGGTTTASSIFLRHLRLESRLLLPIKIFLLSMVKRLWEWQTKCMLTFSLRRLLREQFQ